MAKHVRPNGIVQRFRRGISADQREATTTPTHTRPSPATRTREIHAIDERPSQIVERRVGIANDDPAV